MLRHFCTQALKELSEYKGKNKDDIFGQHVSTRLEISFETYMEELTSGVEYLERRKSINVLRKLNKL